MDSEDDMHDANDLEEFYSSDNVDDTDNDEAADYVFDNDSDDGSEKLVSIREKVRYFKFFFGHDLI